MISTRTCKAQTMSYSCRLLAMVAMVVAGKRDFTCHLEASKGFLVVCKPPGSFQPNAASRVDAYTHTALQDVVAIMDVETCCDEELSPQSSPIVPPLPRQQVGFTIDHVKRMILRIAFLAGQAGTTFEAGHSHDGVRLTGRGARNDFTRLIGTLDGTFMLLNHRTFKVRENTSIQLV